MTQIQRVYTIERTIRGRPAAVRMQVRQQETRPILEALRTYLEANYDPDTPRSPWGKAVAYTRTRWEKLIGFVEDGRVEADTNLVENRIRRIVVGQKNYLFAGSNTAARYAALMYSFFGTCKLHHVNPRKWLTDVLERLPTHPEERLAELLPHRWTPLETNTQAQAA